MAYLTTNLPIIKLKCFTALLLSTAFFKGENEKLLYKLIPAIAEKCDSQVTIVRREIFNLYVTQICDLFFRTLSRSFKYFNFGAISIC